MGELLSKITETLFHGIHYSREPLKDAINRQRTKVLEADRLYRKLLPDSTPIHKAAMLASGGQWVDELISSMSEIYQTHEVTLWDRWVLHLPPRKLIIGKDIRSEAVFGIPGWFDP